MTAIRHGIVYAIGPIDDFGGAGWRLHEGCGPSELDATVDHAVRHIRAHPEYELPERSRQGGPWVLPLPSNPYSDEPAVYAVALKINNNGTTFIWSPCALPWLEPEHRRPCGSCTLTEARRFFS